MAQIQATHTISGHKAPDVYQAVLKAAPKAGLQVWKRRDVAWLAMVRTGTGSDAINGNVSVQPGVKVTVALSAAELSEQDLHARADDIFRELGAALS